MSATDIPDRSFDPATHEIYSPLPARPQYEWPKRIFDRTAGFTLFVLLFPAMAIAWALVRLTSNGPGIYTQTRVGLDGQNYRIFKLRTMTHNCEAKTGGAKWSTKGDTRVTPLGKILRTLHIDELPQLWNVIRGDMSLVGPRPERPEFVGLLIEQIPGYRDHVQSRGLWLDLRLIVGTGFYLLGFSYAAVQSLFSLPNPLAESRKTPETCPSSIYNQYQANRKPLSASDSFAVNSV
jgi:lipopolysaccharide/colanic/teichoic acid biosynthesis glycosyltransferase